MAVLSPGCSRHAISNPSASATRPRTGPSRSPETIITPRPRRLRSATTSPASARKDLAQQQHRQRAHHGAGRSASQPGSSRRASVTASCASQEIRAAQPRLDAVHHRAHAAPRLLDNIVEGRSRRAIARQCPGPGDGWSSGPACLRAPPIASSSAPRLTSRASGVVSVTGLSKTTVSQARCARHRHRR